MGSPHPKKELQVPSWRRSKEVPILNTESQWPGAALNRIFLVALGAVAHLGESRAGAHGAVEEKWLALVCTSAEGPALPEALPPASKWGEELDFPCPRRNEAPWEAVAGLTAPPV